MPMAYSITEIRGIGTDVAEILKKEGIRTTIALLRAAKTPKQRLRLAAKTGTDSKEILDWVTAADRMRVKGVGFGYAELLRAAGVKTVNDLKLRNPQNLAKRMDDLQNRKLVHALPKQKTIARWIESAKKLPAIIRY
jgi:predicted flap endonuclease-1-like 5' DNA nuclease